jgi:hypothetical protein
VGESKPRFKKAGCTEENEHEQVDRARSSSLSATRSMISEMRGSRSLYRRGGVQMNFRQDASASDIGSERIAADLRAHNASGTAEILVIQNSTE